MSQSCAICKTASAVMTYRVTVRSSLATWPGEIREIPSCASRDHQDAAKAHGKVLGVALLLGAGFVVDVARGALVWWGLVRP